MNRKLALLSIPFLALVFSSVVACSNEEKTYDVFFSELYQTESSNEAILEIGTTSKEEYSLKGLKVNFYSGKDLAYSYAFDEETITYDKPLLFVNKDIKFSSSTTSLIKLDDNYIYSGYYLEIVNQNDEVIDCIGHKGYIVKLFENQSMVRLEEKMIPSKEFNPLNFVNIRAGVTSYLGNLNAPISLEELMSGPRLDESLYGNLPFANNGDGTGGYCQVNLQSLGDGDTTYFNFPSESGVSSDDRVRYLLIDTPEVDHGPGGVDEEARGNEAKRVNNEKLSNATGIIVQSNKDNPLYETFGRMLGYVWYTNEDKNDLSSYRLLNFEMVLDGLAEFAESDLYETMYYKDVLYYDYLSYANDYAASLGLKIHGEKDPNFN